MMMKRRNLSCVSATAGLLVALANATSNNKHADHNQR